jgi:hypothetical protein
MSYILYSVLRSPSETGFSVTNCRESECPAIAGEPNYMRRRWRRLGFQLLNDGSAGLVMY